MGVKLRQNVKSSGVKSLFLDISVNGKRYKEYLGLHLEPPKDAEARAKNKETRQLAEKIRANKELDLQTQEYNYTPRYKKNVDFVAYYSKFVSDYAHVDNRIVSGSFEWFKKFLDDQKIKSLRPLDLTPELCKKYTEYMQASLHGETPYNYYSKFKQVVRQALKDKLITDNPAEGIRVVKDDSLKKDILNFDEIQLLANTYCGNPEIKRAFLFSLNTGMRWCDVKILKFRNIDYASKRLSYNQEKTKHSSKNSTVTMDLNATALKLLGNMKDPDELVFTLPSFTGCNNTLDYWVKRAKINKNITWHCARHSFAVNLLGECRADIKTVASLLGHSGLKHTEKYTRVVDELKSKAVNSLPVIEL